MSFVPTSYSINSRHQLSHFFFFNDTATTEIYTLSLHDALPILRSHPIAESRRGRRAPRRTDRARRRWGAFARSEEHTSELQSRLHLVCRLLLEKKKKQIISFFFLKKKKKKNKK